MPFCLFVLLIIFIPTFVSAKEYVLEEIFVPGNCGMYIYEGMPSPLSQQARKHKLLAYESYEENYRLHLRIASKDVILLGKASPEEDLSSDEFLRHTYNNHHDSVVLEAKKLPVEQYCPKEEISDEGCEFVRYTGQLTFQYDDKVSAYTVFVDSGC